METRGAVGADQALGATVAGNEAVGAIRIAGAAVVIVDLALHADQTCVVAAVGGSGASLVAHAALGAHASRQIADKAALTVLVDAALHATMKRGVTARKSSRAAIAVSHALEANAALHVAA